MKVAAWMTGIIGAISTSTCIAANSCKPIHLSVLNLSGQEVHIISAHDKVTTISAHHGSVNDASEALQPQRAQLNNLCGRFTLVIGGVTREIYVLYYRDMPAGHIASVQIELREDNHYQVTGTRDVIPNLQAFKEWYTLRPLVK